MIILPSKWFFKRSLLNQFSSRISNCTEYRNDLIVRYKMKHTCRVVCSNLGANRSQMFYFSRAILVLTIEAGLWCFAEVKQYWLIGFSMDITCNAKGSNHWLRSLAFLLTAKLLLLFILIFWEKKVKTYTIKYMYMYIYGKSSFNDYQGNDECHKA